MDKLVDQIIPILLGLLTTGIVAMIKLTISQRRDVRELLKINRLQTDNIGTLNQCTKLHIKATRSHNYALKEVIRDDCQTAVQSVESAKEHIEKAEDLLSCQASANTMAAMAVGV